MFIDGESGADRAARSRSPITTGPSGSQCETKLEVQELIAARFPKPDVPSQIVDLAPAIPAQAALAVAGLAPARSLPSTDVSRAHVVPLSPARYRVELTVSKELRDKLEHAKDMMRHRNPAGDLAVILDQAIDLLLAKLEKQRLANPRGLMRPR